MEIRPAAPADAEAIERIRIRGWQKAYRHVFPPADLDAMPVDSSRWFQWLTSAAMTGQWCFVAEDEQGMLGWCNAGPSAFPDQFGELHGLYVDPARWGQGAGRVLLARAEEQLATRWNVAILWTSKRLPLPGRMARFRFACGSGPHRERRGVTPVEQRDEGLNRRQACRRSTN